MEFCSSFFGKNEGITFPDNKFPSILGFNGTHDGSGYHIGYKMLDTFENLAMTEDEEKTFVGDYPFDLSAGKQLIFIYVNIIEYQYVGDTKAPLIRVIDSKQRLKNGSPCEIEPTHRIVFSNLEYKKLLSKNFQSIEIQLRTKIGQLVPFAGTGKVILTLNFKKFDSMEAYYQQQSVPPYFSGHYGQRGSGFGALTAGIGRAALPIARKFLWLVAKKTGL